MLLDLKMPKVDELEVLERVKADPALKTVPVGMPTASGEEKDLVWSYGRGANAYLMKPVKFHDFVEAVKEVGLFWVIANHWSLQA